MATRTRRIRPLDAHGSSRGKPATVQQLGPRPGAAPWSPPARRVKLATRDPRRGRR